MEKVSTYDEITHFFGMLSNLFEVVTTVTGLNILEDALDQVEAIIEFKAELPRSFIAEDILVSWLVSCHGPI